MKGYTDLEQSKKLSEILPHESADMYYGYKKDKPEFLPYSDIEVVGLCFPCWSLAALLDVLPSATLDTSDDHYCRFRCQQRCTEWYDNPIDACYKLIIKLNEQKLL